MKGNGNNIIAPIDYEFEISYKDAIVGDMILCRKTGIWDRIKEIIKDDLRFETIFLTTHNKQYNVSEVMVVRY